MILLFLLRRPRHRDIDRGEHIFDKDAVARGGVVDQHVRHSSYQLAVLNDGRARQVCVQIGTTIL